MITEKQEIIDILQGLLDGELDMNDCSVPDAIAAAIYSMQHHPEEPDWENEAPDWANYYGIDDDNQCRWYKNKPLTDTFENYFVSDGLSQRHYKRDKILFKRPDK